MLSNLEKIRRMSREELAKFLLEFDKDVVMGEMEYCDNICGESCQTIDCPESKVLEAIETWLELDYYN